MAGHSKWANIKRKKEKADLVKNKLFSRASKEIITAVKLGGPDPKGNARLRLAIQKAKDADLPNDNIERLIKKAVSSDEQAYEEMQYELYGYGGVGIIADVMTTNRNRISSEIHIATNKRGGTIAHPGAVSFNFERKGVITVPKTGGMKTPTIEDELFLAVTDAGAEDFSDEDEGAYIITCDPTKLLQVKEAITKIGLPCSDASIEMLPKTWIACSEEDAKANMALIEWLENIDDVDAVYHNLE